MKEFNAEFTWEKLEELGLDGMMTHEEYDDDRRYEVPDEWIKIYDVDNRIVSKVNEKWLEFFLVEYKEFTVTKLRLSNKEARVTIGMYGDGELKLDDCDVEKIIMYDGVPEFIAEIVLK